MDFPISSKTHNPTTPQPLGIRYRCQDINHKKEIMDLQYILKNYRSFTRTATDSWAGPLSTLLETMFESVVSLPYNVQLTELLECSRFSVYTLFDLPHDSDENCELHVVAYDEKPLSLVFKFGDRSHWQSLLIDVEQFKSMAKMLAAAAMDKELEKVEADMLATLNSLDNPYLFFLGDKESMFAVKSPKWMYGFQRLLTTHRGFMVDDNGQAVQLDSIGDFVNKKLHSSDTDAEHIVVTANGQSHVIDGSQLMFELVHGQADLADAMSSYAKASFWVVDAVDIPRKRADVLLRTPNRWTTATMTVIFDSDDDMARFTQAHYDPTREQAELIVYSEFDLNLLGYHGRVFGL